MEPIATLAYVATLSTVVPITFSTGAHNTYDAALAKILPGSATSSINGIAAFSGIVLSPVNKGLKVQKVGPETGLTEGKVNKILKVVKYRICAHTPTSFDACGEATIKFGVHIVVQPVNSASFDGPGDSGALVLSTGSCPQPVGMVVAGNSAVTYVAPLAATGSVPGVLQALQTAAGSGSPSFAMVPGGSGCTATGQAEIVNLDGSTSPVDATVADTDVARALSVLPDFLSSSSSMISNLMAAGFVDGVAIDFSTSPASLDVTAEG